MDKLYYLGPEGSYSHVISENAFGTERILIPCVSPDAIAYRVLGDKTAIGVLSVENSVTSNVHEAIDLLFQHNLLIVQEACLKINLNLIGLKEAGLDDIQVVYSHKKSLVQCAKFIKDHHLQANEVTSTAIGKDIVLANGDKSVGAIGHKKLAKHPDLHIITNSVGDEADNITRFAFVSQVPMPELGGRRNKASIIFTLPQMPGVIAKIMIEFSNAELNIMRIESRPVPGMTWHYQFWMDIERTETLDMAFVEGVLREHALDYKIKGVYQTGRVYES